MKTNYSQATQLATMGRPESGWANTPIVKGSTYLFDNLEQWRAARSKRESERVLSYGARGNETLYALEDAITTLEGGFRTKLFPTGLAAIATTLLGCLKSGDHLLISDGIYDPMRQLCENLLQNYGITHSYFTPTDPEWERHLLPQTRMVYVESPGSLLYDMLDLPAMSRTCKARGILLCADNTWGSGISYRPLHLGCDISIMAATKYLGGHSDVMMGSVTTTAACFKVIEQASVNLGQTVSSDDAFLVLRGIRTLGLRLERHSRNALRIAKWLGDINAVARVFHPALESDPNHQLWKRDASGSNGLISIEFKPDADPHEIEQGIDGLQLFGIGSSWGGFESLVLPVDPARTRLRNDKSIGYLLRLHIGLEDPDDLISDLDAMFSRISEPVSSV